MTVKIRCFQTVNILLYLIMAIVINVLNRYVYNFSLVDYLYLIPLSLASINVATYRFIHSKKNISLIQYFNFLLIIIFSLILILNLPSYTYKQAKEKIVSELVKSKNIKLLDTRLYKNSPIIINPHRKRTQIIIDGWYGFYIKKKDIVEYIIFDNISGKFFVHSKLNYKDF